MGRRHVVDELAGLIGWMLHSFHDWLVPDGRVSKRRAALVILGAALISAALFYVAWPGGLPS